MKKVTNKTVSILLVLALLVCMIPCVVTHAKAATTSQNNIVARADYMYNTTWVCQKDIAAWCGEATFYAGETYRIPYGQPITAGYYIGYGVSVDDFLAAAADASSIYYSAQSTYGDYYAPYYANDCSAFVSWCWGISRNTTYSIPNYATYIGMANSTNVYDLELGDALNSNSVGHVVLVTDLVYTNGVLTSIEITEQTPPQLKRSYYTPSELAAKYGADYGIYRYEGTVPEAPETGYLTECTSYASHCLIEITTATPVNSLPCTVGIDEESKLLETASAGDGYTAIGLYKNTQGELWYAVSTASGETGYVWAGDTEYLLELTDDITLTDADVPNGHVSGNIFYVTGVISSDYNQLKKAAVYIYSGLGTDGTVITGGSDSVSSNYYNLKNSNIDNSTAFNQISTGNYTYAISVTYTNYYASDATTVASNSGTINLLEEYFVVVRQSVDQDSCSHSFTSTVVREASCTESSLTVKTCATCGLVVEEEDDSSGHSYGDWTVIQAAGCETEGTQSRTCGLCGDVETEVIPATGHSYVSEYVEATCQAYARTVYTCPACGDSYNVYDGEYTEWSETYPAELSEDMIESRQEYRYSDYETVTSDSGTLDGYELAGTDWEAVSTSSVEYVASWPSGFDTTHELYAQYDNEDAKVEDAETETSKTEIDSDEVTGYLYYHWCYDNSYESRSYKTGSFTTFHAYYDTTAPSSYRTDTSDNSYMTSHSTCSDSSWWFCTEVYTQSYTNYEKVYIQGRWGEWSEWSDEAAEATDTRQVETRTVYRWIDAQLGDHDYVNGVCSVCGDIIQTGCTHESHNPDGTCKSCGEAVSHNYESVVTAPTCTEQGYTTYTCSCGDNYVSDYVEATGHSYESVVTDPTCTEGGYTTHTCPGCGDSYTDSETAATGEHDYVDGVCTECGAEEPVAEPELFDIAYASMTMGNSLTINFAFAQDAAEDWTGCYVQITKTYADDRDDVVETIPYASWGTATINSKGYYCVSFDGIAAKEMSDEIYVTVYNADGEAISNTKTDSVRAQSMRIIDNVSAEEKTMVVDMLNYGAAAQEYFSYNTSDLANSLLTDTQASCASEPKAYTDIRATSDENGDYYYASNVNLESNIQLMFAFKNVNPDMYAVISYSNHYGVKKNLVIDGEAFTFNGNYCVLTIDSLVVADGRQAVTCEIYDSDGNLVVSVTDSLESYTARKNGESELFSRMMQYSDSAYAYFHN